MQAGDLGRDRTSADCDCAFRSGFRDSPRVHGLRGLGRSNPAQASGDVGNRWAQNAQGVESRNNDRNPRPRHTNAYLKLHKSPTPRLTSLSILNSWAGCCDSFRVRGQSVRVRAAVGQGAQRRGRLLGAER